MQLQIALDTGGSLKLDDSFATMGSTTIQFANGDALDVEALVSELLLTPLNLGLGDGGGRLYGGAGADTLFGGAGADTLLGYNGNDSLYGKGGADILDGGAGHDWYEIDNALDSVVERADGGNDYALASVSWVMADNLERLELGGTANIDATGNAQDNTLMGNAGNNTLTGGGGNDLLLGQKGNDVYAFNLGDGQDGVWDQDVVGGMDTLRFGAGIAESDVVAYRYGNTLVFRIKNTSDQVSLIGHYDGTSVVNGETWDSKINQSALSSANDAKFVLVA